MRVLIIDDDADALALLENALQEFGYEVTAARDGREALELIRTQYFPLVVCDWEMPEMTGPELCQQVRQRMASGYTYFILLTSRGGTSNLIDGLRAGADEFLTKPVDPYEMEMRLRVAQRIVSLESRDVVIFSMAKLAEARDTDTGAHLERVREYCKIIGQHLSGIDKYRGQLDSDYIQLLYLTSPLHDIGKVGIPDRILLKPGKLTAPEFEIMKQHVTIGEQTLAAAIQAHPEAQYLRMARDIAAMHHEKFDGTGYPYGLQGQQIPLCGRIVALSDVYDALTTARVYKPAYSHEVARSIIIEGAGKHFDPLVVEAFVAHEDEFIRIQERLRDPGIVPADSTGGPSVEPADATAQLCAS